MPKLYEYFGLLILFYSNEHEPVHGLYKGRECRADFTIINGKVVRIDFKEVKGRRLLAAPLFNGFKNLVNRFSDAIVQKWVDYFVLHKAIQPERIDRRLK